METPRYRRSEKGDPVVAENVIVVRFEEERKAYQAFSFLKQTRGARSGSRKGRIATRESG